MLDILSYLLGLKNGGGGSGEITVVAYTATANGDYTAPEGKAYSPFHVKIPVYNGSVEDA